MTMTQLSSRQFNQDTSRTKRAAKRGPVVITDLLAMPEAADLEFNPPRVRDKFNQLRDLS
jgi:hypothetical protein